MTYTLQEIESQAEAWRASLKEFWEFQPALRAYLRKNSFSRIFVVGCGSTYYLARSAAAFLTLYTPYPVKALPASEAWLLDGSLTIEGTLLLAISRSGTTTETVRAAEKFRADGGEAVAAITCHPESPLAALADVVLAAPAAQERSVVQTRAFTSMYLLAAAFAYTLGNQPELLSEMDQMPRLLETLIGEYGHFLLDWADLGRFHKVFFLGDGPNYGLACEAMLKVKEMSLSWTEAYHTLEFRHGPMSLVDDHTLVVGFLSDAMHQAELDVLRDLKELGAAIVLCDEDRVWEPAWVPEFHLRVKAEINEWLRGLLYLPLMQHLAYQRALANNQTPDQPKNLRQVIKI
jgi:glucosamine--fructose-6-phosphate aminotransferase (isomerizing)